MAGASLCGHHTHCAPVRENLAQLFGPKTKKLVGGMTLGTATAKRQPPTPVVPYLCLRLGQLYSAPSRGLGRLHLRDTLVNVLIQLPIGGAGRQRLVTDRAPRLRPHTLRLRGGRRRAGPALPPGRHLQQPLGVLLVRLYRYAPFQPTRGADSVAGPYERCSAECGRPGRNARGRTGDSVPEHAFAHSRSDGAGGEALGPWPSPPPTDISTILLGLSDDRPGILRQIFDAQFCFQVRPELSDPHPTTPPHAS